MNPFFYIGAFALALGILITVHELGHYSVARLCGVKVLRFSIGFGRPLITRRYGSDRTEWVLALFPLGGYVKMLDEREGEVDAAELHRAFNRQSVGRRFAIVSAGPVANFLLAVLLYWGLFIHGTEELRPVLAAPATGTPAAMAGVTEGELVRSIDGRKVISAQDLRWNVAQAAVEGATLTLETISESNEVHFRRVDLSGLGAEVDASLMERAGLQQFRPRIPPVVGAITADGAAARAGVMPGDRILSIDGQAFDDWTTMVGLVRERGGRTVTLKVARGGAQTDLSAEVTEVEENGKRFGRLGISPETDPALRDRMFVTADHGVVEAFNMAVTQTWDTALFSLKAFGRMITGELSWKNLSGPVTIADYAGQSASMGLTHYIKFLALISISLCVLNLLPIPMLDGGHLMYYTIELIRGGPVSERIMEIGQQIGLAFLLMLMAFAFYNDINRLFG
ncbi:MAG: RIP metalloprotease RseP [Methyloversatilis sp.]|nr:RIP metalloprotease RseP [Methyloversatilis sp.]MBP6193220.1 RIP metalloprotease RseP [Methyloversatilis sp.]MBP9117818.1 RIP metalloprotease RseP [Methyloversatilis sp.]